MKGRKLLKIEKMNSIKFFIFLLLISFNTSEFCISCACTQEVKNNEKIINNQRDVKNKFIGPQIRLGKRIHGNKNDFNKLIKILKEIASSQNSMIS